MSLRNRLEQVQKLQRGKLVGQIVVHGKQSPPPQQMPLERALGGTTSATTIKLRQPSVTGKKRSSASQQETPTQNKRSRVVSPSSVGCRNEMQLSEPSRLQQKKGRQTQLGQQKDSGRKKILDILKRACTDKSGPSGALQLEEEADIGIEVVQEVQDVDEVQGIDQERGAKRVSLSKNAR